MNILVRLPNWIGDVVMSTAFLIKLKEIYKECSIDVILKEEQKDLIGYLPNIRKTFLLAEKKTTIKEIILISKKISKETSYDLYFTLHDTFASALIGLLIGAKERIGFKAGWNSILLTKAFDKPLDLHRVEEYLFLLKLYFGRIGIFRGEVKLTSPNPMDELIPDIPPEFIVFSATSEAQARTIPLDWATKMAEKFIQNYFLPIVFIGSPSNREYYDHLIDQLIIPSFGINLAGKCNASDLIKIIQSAEMVISTDSGISHIANALNKKLIVMFGAGNEFNTGPYNKENVTIMRSMLECSPCVSNVCKFGDPKCLLSLDVNDVVKKAGKLIEG